MLEASVLTEKGRSMISSLLQWGEDGVLDDGDVSNPGLLSGKAVCPACALEYLTLTHQFVFL
jgi:hypothetical protein